MKKIIDLEEISGKNIDIGLKISMIRELTYDASASHSLSEKIRLEQAIIRIKKIADSLYKDIKP
ncbi:MAG: hypothetical protein AABY22_03900 [Nanoarchaeota archaeon]